MNNKIQINHKYRFQVSEPWDYTHPKFGSNKILGTVIDINEEWVIFKCEDSVEYNNISGDILILLARYYDDKTDDIDSTFGASILYLDHKQNRKIEANYAFIGRLKEC